MLNTIDYTLVSLYILVPLLVNFLFWPRIHETKLSWLFVSFLSVGYIKYYRYQDWEIEKSIPPCLV